jgi:hypothetical protein
MKFVDCELECSCDPRYKRDWFVRLENMPTQIVIQCNDCGDEIAIGFGKKSLDYFGPEGVSMKEKANHSFGTEDPWYCENTILLDATGNPLNWGVDNETND